MQGDTRAGKGTVPVILVSVALAARTQVAKPLSRQHVPAPSLLVVVVHLEDLDAEVPTHELAKYRGRVPCHPSASQRQRRARIPFSDWPLSTSLLSPLDWAYWRPASTNIAITSFPFDIPSTRL